MTSTPDTKNRGGRPATGQGTPVMVRLQPEQLGMLDAWREDQDDKPSRPEAVRRLMVEALKPPTAWELLRTLYASHADWRERFGFDGTHAQTPDDAVDMVRADARKKGVVVALRDAAPDEAEAGRGDALLALIARIDPRATGS